MMKLAYLFMLMCIVSSADDASNWAQLAVGIRDAIVSCKSDKTCTLTNCPNPESSTFGADFAGMVDSKKCVCLNDAVQCAYSRCPAGDVKTACTNVVNGLKNYGFTGCSSINCNAGFAGAMPSFAIIGSCLMLLLGMMWAH